MEEKFNEATINRPEGDRLLDAPFVVADLAAHIQQITGEEAWQKNDRNAITLFKGEEASVVLIALKDGAEFNTPSPSAGVMVIQVMDGELNVEIEGQTSAVSRQQLISFHGQLQYNITAAGQTIFLLNRYKH